MNLENIELIERRKLSREELAQELEKAKVINNSWEVRQAWNELVEWLKINLGETEANIFINDTFTYNDFLTDIRLSI